MSGKSIKGRYLWPTKFIAAKEMPIKVEICNKVFLHISLKDIVRRSIFGKTLEKFRTLKQCEYPIKGNKKLGESSENSVRVVAAKINGCDVAPALENAKHIFSLNCF